MDGGEQSHTHPGAGAEAAHAGHACGALPVPPPPRGAAVTRRSCTPITMDGEELQPGDPMLLLQILEDITEPEKRKVDIRRLIQKLHRRSAEQEHGRAARLSVEKLRHHPRSP